MWIFENTSGGGDYSETLTVSKTLGTIFPALGESFDLLPGTGTSCLLTVISSGSVTLCELYLEGGTSTAGTILNEGTLVLDEVVIEHFDETDSAGGGSH